MVLVARHQAPEVVQPREEALDLPAPAAAPQWATVLRLPPAAPVRRDHLDLALLPEPCIEPITIVRPIADESRGLLLGHEGVEGGVDERDFIRRGTCDGYADRKTSAVCHCHDLGPFPPAGGADAGAPCFAPA